MEEWEFAAAHRLGVHWQATGDYDRAQAAYRKALAYAPQHRPSLFNLAVVQIRLREYEQAERTLDRLGALEPDGSWSAADYPIAYYRALIADYRNDHEEAERWSQPLAEAALGWSMPQAGRDESEASYLAQLQMPALMLRAGILVGEASDSAVDDAADALVGDPEPRELTVDDAASIIHHVRQQAGEDPRTHYNLACVAARVLRRAPSSRTEEELVAAAARETEQALVDPHLAAWARRDPSLASVQGERRWQEAMRRTEPEPPAPTSSPRSEPENDSSSPPSVPRGRRELVEIVLDVLKAVHVTGVPDGVVDAFADLHRNAPALPMREFRIGLARAVTRLSDSLTVYRSPDVADAVRLVPITIQECGDGRNGSRFVVVASTPDGPPEGATVTHWNGEPIEDVVERRAALVPAAGAAARRARALATLAHRPAGLLDPFAEQDAVVSVLDADGKSRAWTMEWHEVSLPAREERELESVDPLVDAVARFHVADLADEAPGGPALVRVGRFEPGSAASALDRIHAEPDGVVLDVRGNPGGDLREVEQLLAGIAGRTLPPLLYERRNGDAADELAEAWSAPGRRAAVLRRARSSRRTSAPLFPDEPLAPATDSPARVVVLADALCGGAADVFIARFHDLGLGPIVSTARTLSGMGSLAASLDLPPLRSDEDWARDAGGLDVSYARSVRTGERAVSSPDVFAVAQRSRTLRDALERDADLRDAAARLVSRRPYRQRP